MIEVPHELHGLSPRHSLASWLAAFAAALTAVFAAGALPRLWG
jgi:hypothetical protein